MKIDEKSVDLIIERLNERVRKCNQIYLKHIGQSIKQIRNLKPTQAYKLAQILKYGGNYEEIVREIKKNTDLNVKEINEIFDNYAKKDQLFYERFYKYRNIPFVPFDENKAIKTQTRTLSNIVRKEMNNYLRSNVLGYTITDEKGHLIFKGLREVYNDAIDLAVLNVGQGKETFDSAMKGILKDIGRSGLKTLNYESGRNIRLDSVINMHLKSRLRELHNENQLIYGEEFGADGVEISVHENPAPDHEKVQGRQFSTVKPGKNKLSEWEKLQAGRVAKDYKGQTYTLDHDRKNGYRPISELNCYHYIFSIILGVSEPEYTNKELRDIISNNEEGFYLYDKKTGKKIHYTNYAGTQLQRNLERKIREQKDIQILAKESGNEELMLEAQDKITILTRQYKELSNKSGLPTQMQNLLVSGYRRTKKL